MQIEAESTINLIEKIAQQSERIAIKKLANNDRKWADGEEYGHQNGVYIPREWRVDGFFPCLENINSNKPHIFEKIIKTRWIRTGELKESRLVNYSNKGAECHLTRVPKIEFVGISPASWLVVGKCRNKNTENYDCLIVDSSDEDGCTYLENSYELGSDFEYGIFSAHTESSIDKNALEEFIEEILFALDRGTISNLLNTCEFPTTIKLAELAQGAFLREKGLPNLNPFCMANPGDSLMYLSRDVEYRLFKQISTRFYSAKLMHMLSGTSSPPDIKTIVTRLVTCFDSIYKEVMVSASQRSKSRAGYSFEHHVQRMLTDGGVPFQAQRFIGNQRPDFILPSLDVFKDQNKKPEDAFILSLKTLLRERWKQVLGENKHSDLFLGTVDDGIAADSIEEMRSHGIRLVVPESLKTSKYTEYEDHDNVITFKDFFEVELQKRRKVWLDRGINTTFNKSN